MTLFPAGKHGLSLGSLAATLESRRRGRRTGVAMMVSGVALALLGLGLLLTTNGAVGFALGAVVTFLGTALLPVGWAFRSAHRAGPESADGPVRSFTPRVERS